MKTYIVFLRGINVSGQKKIKMADLRDLLTAKGLQNVQTYIQSGNIIIESSHTPHHVQKEIKESILEAYGFEVEVIVRTPNQIREVVRKSPMAGDVDKEPRTYFTLLANTPDPELIRNLEEMDYSPEEITFGTEVIYFYSPAGYGKAKLNNNFLEKKLKVIATTRNWNTLNKLLEMSS